MALAFVKEVGTVDESNTSATSVIDVPVAGVAQNNLIVVSAVHETNTTLTSVTDSQGNTYTAGPTTDITSGDTFRMVTAYGIAATALTDSDTITVTWSASSFSRRKAKALEHSGNATSSFTDGSASAKDDAFPRSAAPSSGNVVTANADDVLVGALTPETGGGVPTITEPASFTSRGSNLTGGASILHSADRIVAATGTYAYAPTLSVDCYWGCAILAFKAAAGGATVTFDATVSGTGAVTAAVVDTRTFSAAVAGTGAVTGAVVETLTLASAVAGTSAIAADTVTTVSFTSAVAGTGAVVAAIVNALTLAAAVAGTGIVTAALSIDTEPQADDGGGTAHATHWWFYYS